jgi:MarR family transcriptional regulator, transcriptional regulator for hemolysin
MPKDQHFFFTLSKIHRLASKEFDKQLKDIGMTHGLAATLLHLDLIGEGTSQRQIAASMEVEQPTMVQLISRLEKRKFVQKKPFPSDKRRNLVYLTPDGHKVLSAVKTIYQATYQKLFGHIEKDQLDRTEYLLMQVYEASKYLPLKTR